MQYSIFLTALCASSALAIQVTQPTNTTVWKDAASNTIKWTSVDTDPSTVNILLVNDVNNPSTSITIASNIQTSAGQYTATDLSGVGAGFRINLVSTSPQDQGILAQSAQFTLSDAPGTTTTSSRSSTTASSTSTSISSASASAASTASTASTGSTGSTGSTASTGSVASTATGTGATTLSTATGVTTPTGGSGSTGTSTASASAATQSKSAGNMNTFSMASLIGVGGLLALLF
ncbi:MAG: hypothetical protein MMC33_000602 [Icmadophila ericetorum]|nr:hypothetical protein [Icmadophila ericetorum]